LLEYESEEVKQRFLRKFDDLLRHVGPSTIAFNWLNEDRLEQNGTGILLQIENEYFAVTAAHVTDKVSAHFKERKPSFISGAGVVEQPPILLDHVVILSSPLGDRHRTFTELYDIAAIHLSHPVVEQLLQHNLFLRLENLDLDTEGNRDSWYLILGFTAQDSKPDPVSRVLTSKALAYLASIPTVEPEQLLFFDETIGVPFTFVPEDRHDEEGNPEGPLEPGGISGCGIWRIGPKDQPVWDWKPEEAKLVAIEHKYVSSAQAVIGTRIRYAVEMIWSDFPGLRPTINAVFPSIE
jgi:hypothetical protein